MVRQTFQRAQRLKFVSKSTKETQRIALQLAQEVSKSKSLRHATVIALVGELGAGKTVFIKGFARALGVKGPVNSPTFILIHPYKIPRKASSRGERNIKYGIQNLYHIDAYRIKTYKELISLGIKEIITDPRNVVLIEWAERVKQILPRGHIKVHIDHVDEKTRKLTVNSKQ